MKNTKIPVQVMPATSPAYTMGSLHFTNRQYLIISYETDADQLAALVPPPLKLEAPVVKYEFIAMPDAHTLGGYCESGQVIPVSLNGRKGQLIISMYLNNLPAILAGREIWGFPKKWGDASLGLKNELLMGTLAIQGQEVAIGTMPYKWQSDSIENIAKKSEEPLWMVKTIPHADGSWAVAELVEIQLTNIKVQGAWTGPGRLQLNANVMAPVADLPVKHIVSCNHFICDLTIPMGKRVWNYLTDQAIHS